MTIRNKLEFERELAGWKNLVINAKLAIDKLLPADKKEAETEKLKQSWEGIKKMLKKLYEQNS